jgi:ureidoglycolate dehydrogenase (NAD+)
LTRGNAVAIHAYPLRQFVRTVFETAGFTPDGAEAQADVLLWANLRGVDPHGVQRIA